MSRFKDLYIAELEAEMSRLEDLGVPTEKAYGIAGIRAYDLAADKLADFADAARARRKEQ